MASASVRTAMAVKPHCLSSGRNANRRSLNIRKSLFYSVKELLAGIRKPKRRSRRKLFIQVVIRHAARLLDRHSTHGAQAGNTRPKLLRGAAAKLKGTSPDRLLVPRTAN